MQSRDLGLYLAGGDGLLDCLFGLCRCQSASDLRGRGVFRGRDAGNHILCQQRDNAPS